MQTQVADGDVVARLVGHQPEYVSALSKRTRCQGIKGLAVIEVALERGYCGGVGRGLEHPLEPVPLGLGAGSGQ
ncbi:MAG: hypothetical protein ACI9EF_001973 [Pseudohongiellaceae bacterium]